MARVGGEEFAWILPSTDGAGAYAAAERARQAIEREPFAGVGNLTVSIGVCDAADAGECADAAELYRLADVALYWAKDHGRNIAFRYCSETAARLAGESRSGSRAGEHRLRLRALHAIARMVEQGHPTSQGHADRVADLAGALAQRVGWPASAVSALREAAVLHDVGKIIVPKSVLLKTGQFTEAEWAQMRTHPVVGDDMLEDILSVVQRSWVRGHHERWDGAGYPDGLADTGIPEGARILAMADSWDVMTSARVYSGALTSDDALDEVRRAAGRQFDPCVAAVLVELIGDGASVTALE
jgi:HD-GYP domain-containing protein (c-di-GMP phosphodiesterase class II)